MLYETVAEAYRDLERASGRIALVDRLAALLAGTPAELLPVVCYLRQGLIAPEFAGVDLGLAEKLAVRAVATAAGASAVEFAALVRETGDLGLAAGCWPAWPSRPGRSWSCRSPASPHRPGRGLPPRPDPGHRVLRRRGRGLRRAADGPAGPGPRLRRARRTAGRRR